MPSLPPRGISNHYPPIKKHPRKEKKNQKFYPNAVMRINTDSNMSTHTHNPPFISVPPP